MERRVPDQGDVMTAAYPDPLGISRFTLDRKDRVHAAVLSS
jgi:hypothetical protein